ncbi:MAG: trypsin-like peptidase domain-containing protein [Pirellulales bacterium]
MTDMILDRYHPTPTTPRAAAGLAGWLLSGAVVLFSASISRAQVEAPPDGLGEAGRQSPDETAQAQADWDLVSAYERVVGRAIARAEKSVVSIARNKVQSPEPLGPDPRGIPFRFRRSSAPLDPRDPEFVPNQFGTGVVVDPSGLVVTNYHVVDKDSEHYVTTIDRKVFKMRIKAADPRSDLAVLEVAPDEANKPREGDFVPIVLGDADELKKGETVIALGNPYAIARDGQVSASRGIVANLSRKVGLPASAEDEVRTLHNFGTLIQTDAKLNLGTSGGALINLRGEMVGLTTALAATAGYEMAAGYAIPVDETFRRVLDTLKKGREVEYGFLGIAPLYIDSRDVHRGVRGIKVGTVSSGTPARVFGINEMDRITHIDGVPIYEPDGLRLHVGKLPPRATARLTVERRNGRTDSLDVVLSKYRVRGEKIVTERPPAWRGLRLDFPTAVVRDDLLEEFHNHCLAVSEVEPDSPAWKAGLRPAGNSYTAYTGVLISHVGTTPVTDPGDFYRAVADEPGRVRLTVVNHGEVSFVVVDP